MNIGPEKPHFRVRPTPLVSFPKFMMQYNNFVDSPPRSEQKFHYKY